jgi:hypothetical protein
MQRGPCYRFTQGPDGKVVRIDYRQNREPAADPVFGVATILIRQVDGAEQRSYLDTAGKPAPDTNGVYAVRIRYDARGNPIEWRSLDAEGRPMEAKVSGLAGIRWQHDDRGNTVEELYFSPDDPPQGRPASGGSRGALAVRRQGPDRDHADVRSDRGAGHDPPIATGGDLASHQAPWRLAQRPCSNPRTWAALNASTRPSRSALRTTNAGSIVRPAIA